MGEGGKNMMDVEAVVVDVVEGVGVEGGPNYEALNF